MKQGLLFLSALLLTSVLSAQCTADYDFGDAGFGVSPDPEIGESFDTGYVGVPYQDDLHVLVPSNGGELGDLVPDEWAAFASLINIDSLTLVSVEAFVGDAYVDITDLGLSIECNNNGDSPNPCHFLGGEQYCAALVGTPNQAGVFQLRITVGIHFVLFDENQNLPQTFEDNYFLTIEEDTSVSDLAAVEMNVGQNVPNPCAQRTQIKYTLSGNAPAHFKVTNLLGETIYTSVENGRRGDNTITFDASGLESGLYLYSVEVGQQKFTKRMIVR